MSERKKEKATMDGVERGSGTTSIELHTETNPLPPGGRWSARRKMATVMRMLQGESIDSLSWELGVPHYKLLKWRDRRSAGP